MRRPSGTNIVVIISVVVVAAGVARASIPAANGTIRGCYASDAAGSGAVLKSLYVIDDTERCPDGTTELTWNQTGPVGAPGPQGPAGPPGTAGSAEPKHGAYRTDVRFVQKDVEVYASDTSLKLTTSAEVVCGSDETAIGGGARLQPMRAGPGAFVLTSSYPARRQRSWVVEYTDSNTGGRSRRSFAPLIVIHGWAVCARTLVTAVPLLPPATGVKFGPRP